MGKESEEKDMPEFDVERKMPESEEEVMAYWDEKLEDMMRMMQSLPASDKFLIEFMGVRIEMDDLSEDSLEIAERLLLGAKDLLVWRAERGGDDEMGLDV